jgi:hypothetical protein
MSAAAIEHPSFRCALTELRELVSQANVLGVSFWLSGASVIPGAVPRRAA